jgi:hypothetical protein
MMHLAVSAFVVLIVAFGAVVAVLLAVNVALFIALRARVPQEVTRRPEV